MQTTKIELSKLHKTEKNIRKHSEKQIKEYVRSIKMFGQIRPLVATEDGEILVGNGMYDAMMSMGWTECDAYIMPGLTKAERKKLMMADNKVYELGFTDIGIIDDLIKDLNGDFDVPGYDADMLNMLSANPMEAADEIGSYGTSEPNVAESFQPEQKTYSESPEQTYNPPVRSSDGAFIPHESPAQDVPREMSAENFIICPHCGEKICL